MVQTDQYKLKVNRIKDAFQNCIFFNEYIFQGTKSHTVQQLFVKCIENLIKYVYEIYVSLPPMIHIC